jgi:non-heme chloroperoxidase
VSEDEAQELYKTFTVPGSGATLFQAATANLNPWTEAKVDVAKLRRGTLLIIISGAKTTRFREPWPTQRTTSRRRIRV